MGKIKKYTVNYDRRFFVHGGRAYLEDGREVSGMSLYLAFHLYDKKSGREVFFYGDEDKTSCGGETVARMGDFCHCNLNESFSCSYDRNCDAGYRIDQNWDGQWELITCQPEDECYAWIKGCEDADPVCISHKEFCRILREFPEAFDNSNNKPAQSIACSRWFAVFDDVEESFLQYVRFDLENAAMTLLRARSISWPGLDTEAKMQDAAKKAAEIIIKSQAWETQYRKALIDAVYYGLYCVKEDAEG